MTAIEIIGGLTLAIVLYAIFYVAFRRKPKPVEKVLPVVAADCRNNVLRNNIVIHGDPHHLRQPLKSGSIKPTPDNTNIHAGVWGQSLADVQTGPSLTDMMIAEDLVSLSAPVNSESAPSFGGFGGGDSGGGGASDSWSSDSSSSSSDSSSSLDSSSSSGDSSF